MKNQYIAEDKEKPSYIAEEGQIECCSQASDIYRLLGEAVLVPVAPRTKRPTFDGWSKMTYGETQTLEYQRGLKGANIGVVLGKASKNICSIDLDSDERVEEFLELNPLLANTLRSRGARGMQLWVRINDEYPKLAKLTTSSGENWGEWRADGGQSVIYGIHPKGMKYELLCSERLVEIGFEQIQWPEDLKLPWLKTKYERLVEEEGEPFVLSENGGVSRIKQSHFARRYGLEHNILFDSSTKEFFEYSEESGLWKQKTAETIKRQLSNDIKQIAKDHGAPQLLGKRSDGMMNGILNLMIHRRSPSSAGEALKV